MPPKSILVLGGGLSGLSSAFHLSRRFPTVPITLLEHSNRLGGWVRSERVKVRDNQGHEASILLEGGPRTLRPNGKSVVELVNLLGLHESVITVPKSAPAAKNRFLHIPGTNGLTPLPNSLLSVFTSPIRTVLLGGVLGEPFRARTNWRPAFNHYNDMSFDDFLTYHFGADFARLMGSALAHGIYAADSRLVSVRAAFPSLWDMAGENGTESIVLNTFKRACGFGKSDLKAVAESSAQSYDLGNVEAGLKDASVFSFRDGAEALVQALERELERRQNVTILKSHGIAAISKDTRSGDFVVSDASDVRHLCSHVVSSISLPSLHSVLEFSRSRELNSLGIDHINPPQLPHLVSNPSSSVTVINLIFPPTPGGAIHPDGFGYLVPRKENDTEIGKVNYDSLEDRLLGVVFDSCALSAQDVYPPGTNSNRTFTKLTLMLKGASEANMPSEGDLLALLSKHLVPRAPIPPPVFMRVHLSKDCISTPSVGHLERMAELRKALGGTEKDSFWGGRFEVLGAGVGGVSVPDCIEQGRRLALRWSR
ncbi:unnamed protein product [Somion occarium]|uniref:Protoporphyrinogen oxidase n=1 Tax=Somion occarium TaxID=3059160 RepID=A0ABP1CW93_9APHY